MTVFPQLDALRNVNHNTHTTLGENRTQPTHLNVTLFLQNTDRLFHKPDSPRAISVRISRQEDRADGAQPPRELLQR